jgi:tetrapyrrole methylase family protein/MazG family protein
MFKIQEKYDWKDLLEIMAILRAPDGCSWDQKQTHKSLLEYLREEVAEFIDATLSEDFANMQEELGDVLLQVVFHAQIAKENTHFTIGDVIDGVSKKLVDRHPHVFGDAKDLNFEEVELQWDILKAKEKTSRTSLMDSVPKSLAPLQKSQKIQDRAAKIGFEWPNIRGAWKKLDEEILELKEAIAEKDQAHISEEFGDVLFTMVNMARFLNLRAEESMEEANQKFMQRFRKMEIMQDLAGKSLDELEELWLLAKKN